MRKKEGETYISEDETHTTSEKKRKKKYSWKNCGFSVAFFLSFPNRLGSRLLVDDNFLLLFLGAIHAKKEKKKIVSVTYYVKTRKWWRISDSVCGQRTFFCCCFCLVYGQSSHEENETLCFDSSDLISSRYLIWFDSPSSSQTKIRIDLICFVCLYVPPLVSPQSDDFNCFFFLCVCVGRVQRPFHVKTQPKCISFFIGRLAWNRTAEVSRVTLLSGTCVVFSFLPVKTPQSTNEYSWTLFTPRSDEKHEQIIWN
jgi:hypothetical protein